MPGFETKRNQLGRQAALFAELDSALVAFRRAVSDLGMAESVTVYTDTEFNRTLTPNKSGRHRPRMGRAPSGDGRIDAGRTYLRPVPFP